MKQSNMGAVSELITCVELFKLGYHVFRAQSQHCPFDLIAYKDGVCNRVEVKSIKKNQSSGSVSITPPSNDEWDLIAWVDPTESKFFLYDKTVSVLEMKNNIRLSYGKEVLVDHTPWRTL